MRPHGVWVAMLHNAGMENIECEGLTREEAIESLKERLVSEWDLVIRNAEYDDQFREDIIEL